MTFLPIDLITIGLVAIFTFLFDIIDLQPQVGSFVFLKSTAYFTYYIISLVFAILASFILQLTGIFPNFIELAFVSVIASVTTIHNFRLKVGGHGVADLPSLFETYKKKMITDQIEQDFQRSLTEQINLTSALSEKLTEAELEMHTKTCLHALYSNHEEKSEVQRQLDEIDQAAKSDSALRKTLFAQEIVNTSPEYAKQLLSQKPPNNTA